MIAPGTKEMQMTATNSQTSESVIVRVWQASAGLEVEPLAEFPIARNAELPLLVGTLLVSLGFEEEHLWCLAHPPVPAGQRTVGQRRGDWVPAEWRHFYSPAERDLFIHDASAEYADDFTVEELASVDEDEAWLLFDYGDCHTFRLKFCSVVTERLQVSVPWALHPDDVPSDRVGR